jgi:hypothetical protein
MSDAYSLMQRLCRSKSCNRLAGRWVPPSETQRDLEASLARAIKTFIGEAKLTRSGIVTPGETAHDRLLDQITRCLERAVQEGRQRATGKQERGIINAARNLAGRAVQLVSDIVDSLQSKARDIIAALFGSGEVEDVEEVLAEAESELEQWGESYAEGVAENEIQTAIMESIYVVGREQGVELYDVIHESDACEVCVDIVGDGITVSIEDGERLPPYHFRCKCEALPHEE